MRNWSGSWERNDFVPRLVVKNERPGILKRLLDGGFDDCPPADSSAHRRIRLQRPPGAYLVHHGSLVGISPQPEPDMHISKILAALIFAATPIATTAQLSAPPLIAPPLIAPPPVAPPPVAPLLERIDPLHFPIRTV